MTYREDVAEMEAQSDRVEFLMKGSNLHGFTGGLLNQSETPTTGRDSSNTDNQMASNDIASSGNIDDFTDSKTETIYRLNLGTKVIEVTKKERDLMIVRAAEKLDEKLMAEIQSKSDNEADISLLNFMNFIERY